MLAPLGAAPLESEGKIAAPHHSGFIRGLTFLSFGRNVLRLRTFGGLWIENATVGAEAGARPRRLAVLAILAAAGPKGLTRERLLGILWPDSEPERARHALSQTLYNLRRDVGADVVIATAQDLRLDPALIGSDLADCRAAIRAENWAAVAELYEGRFLEGFYLADADEFERWVEAERLAIAGEAARALEAGARAATDRGAAVGLWRRLTVLDPLSGRFAAGYVQALVAAGERAGALAHAKAYEATLERELGTAPDPSVARLLEQLREPAKRSPAAPPSGSAPEPPIKVAGPASPPPIQKPAVGRRWLGIAAGIAGLAVVGLWWVQTAGPKRADGPPVLAVGSLRDLTATDSTPLGGVLSEMLTTSLARLTDIQVVAHSRILELMSPEDASERGRAEAARRAGAGQILEGEVTMVGRDSVALALRRVDLATGVVQRGYRVVGVDRYAVIDSLTTAIASDLRVEAPLGALADVSTRSPIAYRLYEDGLRASLQSDARSAHRLFRSAIQEDSTFAMATYHAWRTAAMIADPGLDSLGVRALRLASRTPDRDRLVIIAHVGASQGDLGALAAAESLAVRYPSDPEALIRAADVLHAATPNLARTAPLLNRAVAIDSATGPRSALVCRACEALAALVSHAVWADSTALAEQTIRRWTGLQPAGHASWVALADLKLAQGREAEAARALRTADSLGRPAGGPSPEDFSWQLRSDRPEAVTARCSRDLPDALAEVFREMRWWCTIGLRMQGRYREALRLARAGIVPGAPKPRSEMGIEPIQAAWLDFEMGRPLAAGLQFRRFAAEGETRNLPPGLVARTAAWNLTLAATALSATTDTSELRGLADSVEAIGRQSLFGRDPRLHRFIRGLALARAGRLEDAVLAYRAALTSPSFGYTRIGYELGKSLLALNRPAEAVEALRGPLHGGVDGSGLYLTRTEIHELLATAFDAAGQRDSAAAHFAVVARAWQNGDPSVSARYQAARDYPTRIRRPPK